MRTLIAVTPARPAPVPKSLREIVPWLAFIALLAVLSFYLVGPEQGA